MLRIRVRPGSFSSSQNSERTKVAPLYRADNKVSSSRKMNAGNRLGEPAIGRMTPFLRVRPASPPSCSCPSTPQTHPKRKRLPVATAPSGNVRPPKASLPGGMPFLVAQSPFFQRIIPSTGFDPCGDHSPALPGRSRPVQSGPDETNRFTSQTTPLPPPASASYRCRTRRSVRRSRSSPLHPGCRSGFRSPACFAAAAESPA